MITEPIRQTSKRRPDPFNDSADARLIRMGLLTNSGELNKTAMQVFIQIFAGSFFDDLCDTYEEHNQLLQITAAFAELAGQKDSHRIFLLLSLQYDTLRKPLPDPVWWLAGNPHLLQRFTFGFAAYLAQMADDLKKNRKVDIPRETDTCSS